MRRLTETWTLGGIEIPNRVVLAPLAGIGNWFVRLQAHRYGAGLAVSEMVSSFGIHHGNDKTRNEMLRTHPDEGLTSIQLFGQDPDVMRSAAAYVAANTDAKLIDLNMGCPVPKVMKTGAGAAMLKDHDTAVAVAAAAREGSGLPVTVKLRSGEKKGDTSGVELSHRLVAEAGVAGITFHPRSAQVHHKGNPDLDLAKELCASLPAPVILSGGMNEPEWIVDAREFTGAEAIMLARGALGNPWLFARLLDRRDDEPTRDEILGELEWVMDRAVEHLGPDRAGRYLRKFYPWYVERLAPWTGGVKAHESKQLQADLQATFTVGEARDVLTRWAALQPA
ncbi:MAG TPA: tRNA-dihydrouridine synthase [Solirubrobacteraceae bacterium]|nr:tRNA-dihydrouridine synthase [Solirubrobacteraceae bacterium]